MAGIAHASFQQKNYLSVYHILHAFFSRARAGLPRVASRSPLHNGKRGGRAKHTRQRRRARRVVSSSAISTVRSTRAMPPRAVEKQPHVICYSTLAGNSSSGLTARGEKPCS